MAEPQSSLGLHLDPAGLSDGLANESLEFGDKPPRVDRFWIQYLPSREGEELRRQLCAPIDSTSCSRSKTSGLTNIVVSLDQFEVRGDHREQVIKVVRDATGELADALYLLALVELLPCFGQFVLAVLQRIGHGVECPGDPCNFRVARDVHTPVKV